MARQFSKGQIYLATRYTHGVNTKQIFSYSPYWKNIHLRCKFSLLDHTYIKKIFWALRSSTLRLEHVALYKALRGNITGTSSWCVVEERELCRIVLCNIRNSGACQHFGWTTSDTVGCMVKWFNFRASNLGGWAIVVWVRVLVVTLVQDTSL